MEKTYKIISLTFTIERVGVKRYVVRVYNAFDKKIQERWTAGISKPAIKKFVVKDVLKKIYEGTMKGV